jgi:YegS/Rv2252/BmrU family lipid kinase
MTWEPARTRVIVNPRAAGGRVQKHWAATEAMLRSHLGDVSFVQTRSATDAPVLARQALDDGMHTVLAVGGDGTLGAVASALVNTDAHFGILPAGTGGDFRRLFPFGATLESAAAALPTLRSVRTDVGRAEFIADDGTPGVSYFLNLSGCGVAGLVDRYVNRSRRLLGGSVTFAIATLRAVSAYTPMRVRVVVDDHDFGVFFTSTVIVANGQYAGGGMRFAPRAELDDGLLDVVILPQAGLVRAVRDLPKLYAGTHLDWNDVQWFRGRQVKLVPQSGDSFMDIDGESPGSAPATFDVIPGALNMLRGL